MNANEYTDPEGDALTITRKAGKVWITCTTDVTEVTVGPIPATALHDKTLGSYIRTNEPDLMDGGVIAALIEQDAEGHAGKAEENATYWENTSAALTDAVGRWQARTERAVQERDHWKREADGANEDLAHLRAAEPAPSPPDAITDEMVERGLAAWKDEVGRTAGNYGGAMFMALTAALTEPPGRPEWEEEGAKALTVAVWGMEIPSEAGEAGDKLAFSLARHGYKVVPVSAEEQP